MNTIAIALALYLFAQATLAYGTSIRSIVATVLMAVGGVLLLLTESGISFHG